MSESHVYVCEICGLHQQEGLGWFLVRSEGGRDQVSVLRWDPRRADEPNMHPVCGVAHARELVGRWVFSGTLCCAARGARWRVEGPGSSCDSKPPASPATEPLDIDLRRLQNAEPQTLLAILDAVEGALQDKWEQLDDDDQEVLLYDA